MVVNVQNCVKILSVLVLLPSNCVMNASNNASEYFQASIRMFKTAVLCFRNKILDLLCYTAMGAVPAVVLLSMVCVTDTYTCVHKYSNEGF